MQGILLQAILRKHIMIGAAGMEELQRELLASANQREEEKIMNDFTKGELQVILLDMQLYAKKLHIIGEAKAHVELREKVEAMIDNYCDHDNYDDCKCCEGYECEDCGERW